VQLSILVSEAHLPAVLDVLFTETTTIGVRSCPMHRWKLRRERIVVETAYGPLSVKVAMRGEAVLNVAPEHRECQRVAEEQGVPLKEVHQAAIAAARVQARSDLELTKSSEGHP
jgi:hypothetical protein